MESEGFAHIVSLLFSVYGSLNSNSLSHVSRKHPLSTYRQIN